jgi:hypothetical protein
MAANQARWSKSNIAIQELQLEAPVRALRFGMLLADITPQHIGKYQGDPPERRRQRIELSTWRLPLCA